MKLQQTIAKIEEIKALFEMYQDSRQTRAKAVAYAELLQTQGEPLPPEQQADIDQSMGLMDHRLQVLEQLLVGRTGTTTIDEAEAALEELVVRVEQLHSLRRDQLALRASLDVELALGQVVPETRQQVETRLGSLQRRMETHLERIDRLLPGSGLITLV